MITYFSTPSYFHSHTEIGLADDGTQRYLAVFDRFGKPVSKGIPIKHDRQIPKAIDELIRLKIIGKL